MELISAQTAKEMTKSENIDFSSVWLKKAMIHIDSSSRRRTPYCSFHIKYYLGENKDYVYASLAGDQIKILNPLNSNIENQINKVMYQLKELGYSVTPFVGEKPFLIDKNNLTDSIEEGEIVVGSGSLGLYLTWY